MNDLSPDAQAVYNTILKIWPARINEIAAAALRAAADQVVPEFWHEDDDVYGETMQDIRQQLLAIAAELEPSTIENQ
jgi:hypothetical protein